MAVGSSYSFVFWYKLGALPSATTTLLHKGDGSGAAGDEYGIHIDATNTFIVYAGTGGSYSAGTVGAALADGSWHMVMAGRNDSTGQMHWSLDGAVVTAGGGGFANGQNQTANALYLGIFGASGLRAYNGAMDAVGLWTKKLSDGEVSTLYNGGSGIRVANYSGSLLTNLVAGWDLDGPYADGLWHDAINAHHFTDHGGIKVVTGKT